MGRRTISREPDFAQEVADHGDGVFLKRQLG